MDYYEDNMRLFWTFTLERYSIYQKKEVLDRPPPWTDDPIMSQLSTNLFSDIERLYKVFLNIPYKAANEMYHYTYLVQNLINTKIYFGVRSCKHHPSKDKKYLGSGRHIKNAIKKYGKKNFTKMIDRTFNSSDEAFAREVEVVDQEWVEHPLTYNLVTGGINGEWSKATCQKMSESCYKRPRKVCRHCHKDVAINIHGQFHGDKCKMNPNLSEEELRSITESRRRTPEFKAMMSRIHTGKETSEHTRERMRRSKIGYKGKSGKDNPMYGKDPWNKGKLMSLEFCQAIRDGKNKVGEV